MRYILITLISLVLTQIANLIIKLPLVFLDNISSEWAVLLGIFFGTFIGIFSCIVGIGVGKALDYVTGRFENNTTLIKYKNALLILNSFLLVYDLVAVFRFDAKHIVLTLVGIVSAYAFTASAMMSNKFTTE
jgi:hypothetical protein